MTHDPAGQIASRDGTHGGYAWTNHYAVSRAYTTDGLNQYQTSVPALDGAAFVNDL